MLKKFIAIAAAAAMTFGTAEMLPGGVFDTGAVVRSSAETYGDYEYRELEDGTVEITLYVGDDTVVDIPSEIEGKRVTSIGFGAFCDCDSVTSITIPSSVTNIGESAFSWCESLTSITIPDSVKSIGESAFFRCTSLTSITIPKSVTSIGNSAFSSCMGLTSVTIPEGVTSIGRGAFSSCNSLKSINAASDNPNYSSTEGVLYNKTKTELICCPGSKTSMTIPKSVTSIGEMAFCYCENLKSVTIPNSVTSIGGGAFNCCVSLKSITIPDSVTSIGDYAFSWCQNLASITIPNSVTSIDGGAFFGCTDLKEVTIPKSVTEIGENALGYHYDDNLDHAKVDGFKIRCYAGTAAEQYAKANGFECELITALAGDADSSGKVNMKDYVLFQRHLNSWDVDIDLTVLDLNGDNKVNMKDLVLLQRYLNGWNVEFA